MSTLSLIDLSTLRAIARNNEEFVRDVLGVFRENTPNDIDKLKGHIEENNQQMVRYFAHKLKSSCFNIGFTRGYECFKDLESAADKGMAESWSGIFSTASAASTKALAEIDGILSKSL